MILSLQGTMRAAQQALWEMSSQHSSSRLPWSLRSAPGWLPQASSSTALQRAPSRGSARWNAAQADLAAVQ